MAQGTQPVETAMERATRYLWLLWDVWLLFLLYPVEALFKAHPAPLRAAIVFALMAVFAAVYSWNVWRRIRAIRIGSQIGSPWPALAVLAVIASALTAGDRREWIELFIFLGASMGPSLPTVRAIWAVTVVVAYTGLFGGFVLHAGLNLSAQIALQTAVSSFAVIVVVRTVAMQRELRLAHEEIARLAVAEERLRFARDLHDLLGQSLSLIALKSELIGRLIPIDPERAATETGDVEAVARRSLAEVREAVAGYRQAALAAELTNARDILTAAGIDFACDGDLGSLAPAQEAVLAWAVREGVTNVIKHSRARHCTIRLTRDSDYTGVEISDDGATSPAQNIAADGDAKGSGLRGLAERAAALGGRCAGGPRPEGGFRLTVTVPATAAPPSPVTT